MYNRYIPQSDGSYRRSRVPDNSPKPPRPAPPPEPVEEESCPPIPPCCEEPPKQHPAPCQRCPKKRQMPRPEPHTAATETGVGSFLKQLLPKDFDTGDLLVVILLLLMSADCKDDQNTALLTLALYLFM